MSLHETTECLGIDLGGTQLRVARIGRDGTIHAAQRAATDLRGPEEVVAQMHRAIIELGGAPAAIGVGIPGAFDAVAGTVLNIPALPGWKDFPLADRLVNLTGLPCVLENDAKVATIGEWTSGAAKGCSDFVFVTVSTGIGAGIVAGNRLLRGLGGLAGEVGHNRITDSGPRCACGHFGCWQAVAAGPALASAARDALLTAPDALLADYVSDSGITSRDVGIAARAGCVVAIGLLNEEAGWLAEGFVNLQHAYAPERIVVGGGVSRLLDLMTPRILARMAERRLPGFPEIPIVVAQLDDDAGLIGASGVAFALIEPAA